MSTILITGAGRGLGLELARQYAQDGWRVIGTVRDGDLKRIGAESLKVDVTDFAQVKTLQARLKGEPLDVLFCNAGIIGKRGMALGSFDYPEWEKVLRVNLLGAAAVIEALVDNVAASERKTIAVMSSRLGSISETSGMTLPYSTSKAALNLRGNAAAARRYRRGAEPRVGEDRHGRAGRAAHARGLDARAAHGARRPAPRRLRQVLLPRRLADSLVGPSGAFRA